MPAVTGASPCVNICVMEPDAGICIGCGRTLAEIAGWSSFSASDRETINAACLARLDELPRPIPGVA